MALESGTWLALDYGSSKSHQPLLASMTENSTKKTKNAFGNGCSLQAHIQPHSCGLLDCSQSLCMSGQFALTLYKPPQVFYILSSQCLSPGHCVSSGVDALYGDSHFDKFPLHPYGQVNQKKPVNH